MLHNDVYQDQINLNSLASVWSARFFKQLFNDLNMLGWKIKSTSYNSVDVGFSLKTVAMINEQLTQSLVVNVHHHLPDDVDLDSLIITDVIVKNRPNKILAMYPEVYGHFYSEFKYQSCNLTKKFNCFINRGCPLRQSWIYQLQRNNLLDQGYVTYWCEDRFNKTKPAEYFEELFQKNNHIFEQEHIALRGKIPFKNFDFSIEDAILNSTISLIIETFFDNNNYVCYSEKIWRNLQLPRPWVMFNSMHAVKHLREFGFDVLDDYVDHSYDLEPNIITRQMMILEQIKKDITLTDLNLLDLEQRAQYNRMLMKQYLEKWPNRYKKIIETIKNISNSESPTYGHEPRLVGHKPQGEL